jgi:PAS domain S-box-containing protein
MAARRRSGEDIRRDLRRLTETSGGDRDRFELLHEVQVHQEEITVQNEELTRAQAALEEARDLFIDLYDFAPTGYLTLDAHGVILQLNLTAATILGKPRQAIEGGPLLGFIAPGQRRNLLEYLRRCRQQAEGASVTGELALNSPGGLRDVQLLCRARPRKAGAKRLEFLVTMIDVTERKRLESERDEAARERAALAGRLLKAHEEERQRIARDLHDHVGQQMTALKLKVSALAGLPPTGVQTQVADVQNLLDDLEQQLDFMAADLRPAVLDVGIVAALRDFVDAWTDTYGIRAELHTVGMDGQRLSPEVETHVYRVAQEALHNVYKHAHATRVSVLLERRADEVVLVVEDDGRAFDPAVRSGGFGLAGMRERAAIVHGALELESVSGQGTTVYLRVPAGKAPAQPVATRRQSRNRV